MGWTRFLTDAGGSATPLSSSLSLLALKQLGAAVGEIKKLWAGIKTLNDFLDSGEPPVASELAEARASVCVLCPKNGQGDFTRWFVKPVALAIKLQLEKLQERKISTSKDAQLNLCEICLCTLKLKTQTPMKYIKPQMPDGMLNELRAANEHCWIVKEVESETG